MDPRLRSSFVKTSKKLHPRRLSLPLKRSPSFKNKRSPSLKLKRGSSLRGKLMGQASSVSVIHTPCVDKDCEAIRAIFPDRFQQAESYGAGELVLIEENATLLFLPTSLDVAPQTVSTLTLEPNWLRLAAERASIYGISMQQNQNATVLQFTLPGGARVLAATPEAWKEKETRTQIIQMSKKEPEKEQRPIEQQRQLDASSSSIQDDVSASPVKEDIEVRTSRSTPSKSSRPNRHDLVRSNKLFPTLRTRVTTVGSELQHVPFPLNAQNPVDVETDLFVGKMCMIMRPEQASKDPYWTDRIFSKKKRLFAFQMQGKFKYKPTGTVIAGIEITEDMKLGLVTSSLCNFLLKFVRTFNNNLHYSFGDGGTQRPHIVFPASTFIDRMVVTKPGETPPPIGEGVCEFDEPPSSYNPRKAYKTKIDWNTEDTYSMSFHSMYVNWPSWSIVRLPLKKDMGLSQFWGKALASIVFYEHQGDFNSPHKMNENKYIMGLQMQFLGKGATEDDDWGDESSLSDSSDSGEEEAIIATNPIGADDDDGSVMFFDSVQSEAAINQEASLDATKITPMTPHFDILRIADRFCPAWIDVCDDRLKRGKYARVFALQLGLKENAVLRTWDHSSESLGDRQMKPLGDRFSPRLSTTERRRRVLGLRLSEAQSGKASLTRLRKFMSVRNKYDQNFLQRAPPQNIKRTGSIQSCYVARALSDRHWVEEWAVLDTREIQFYHPTKSKSSHVTSISSVVVVRAIPEEECPFLPQYHFLSIETFGRTIYLMFHSKNDRNIWVETLTNMDMRRRPSLKKLQGQERTVIMMNVDNPTEEFMHKSSLWDYDKRRILNCRKFSLRTISAGSPPDSLRLAENALRSALELQPDRAFDGNQLRRFLSHAAALKDADAWSLQENERQAFFLNLYHTMILHGYLVMGLPDTSIKWLSYFNRIAYQCSDDIFSLTELEHNIVRSNMAFPSQFISRLVVPKSEYGFALSRADARFNFALNCGSTSIPTNKVRVYKADRINEQLDATASQFLNATVNITQRSTSSPSITIPKVCQWFASDFGDGSSSDLIKRIFPFLNESKQKQLRQYWNQQENRYDIRSNNIKHLSFTFDGRFFALEDEESIQE